MIMYAAAAGNAITAVFQCLSAISVKGFLTLSLRWFLFVAFLYLLQMFWHALLFGRSVLFFAFEKPLCIGKLLFQLRQNFVLQVLIFTALSCTFIIRFRIWRNCAILISSVGLGGISFSRIRFCRKSFAFATIPRNRIVRKQPFHHI